jgi:hypothetical protein
MPRFEMAGHRITGDRQQGRSYGVGYDKVHVAVDDATRLAYVEVLAKAERLFRPSAGNGPTPCRSGTPKERT